MKFFLALWILNWLFRPVELHYIRIRSKCNFLFSRYSTTCGSNGIFSRRLDFSLYNVLPKQRINSIEVKVIMEISFILAPAKLAKLQIIAIMQKKFSLKV